jgi:hypothetical protein
MPTPLEFMKQYRNLKVSVGTEDSVARISRLVAHVVQLRKYFMMDWQEGTEEKRDYGVVTRGSRDDEWFQANKERIRTAAMGKGAPADYELALEWAVRSRKIATVSQPTLQTYCDNHLGIDCSGFVTNYLVACGKRSYSSNTVRNTNAASYFNAATAVNDANQVRRGDLLVWMNGNSVKTNPGHIAVVESYVAQSRIGGNMSVVEATGASGANPKLLESMYAVERIVPKGGAVPSMILVVKRHGDSGNRVAVIRV